MDQRPTHKFWQFTIRYNVLLLGALYFLILWFAISNLIDRSEDIMNVWKTLLYLLTLIVAFGSWIYCIRKSWTMSNFDHSFRIAIMSYLLGAPVVLLFFSGNIIYMVLHLIGISGSFR